MSEYRIGHPEIAFGILEVDRIDLVWHRRRAHLALFQLLFEIAERNIHPYVPAGIEQYRVATCDRIKQFSHRIMWLDLDRIRIEFQPQRLDEVTVKTRSEERRVGKKSRS